MESDISIDLSADPWELAAIAESIAAMDRSLPKRNVNKDNLTDAYVDFILYCNPQFPLDVDTTQLRTRFESAPKSDNKQFETWRLFVLIRRFNAKEIDTWGQLALELGVEPPDTSKNQSVQKVQQYTVRLKRWMRALHIDAFFEYLNGKEHAYFTDIPPVDAPYPSEGRDGVPTDEDLAIRALEPAFRPKRGRRRNSEIEQEEEELRRQQLGVGTSLDNQPTSAYPRSAVPNSAHPTRGNDPWANASAISAQNFAPWQGPQSAITPSTSHLRWERSDLGDNLTATSPHPVSAYPGNMSAAPFDPDYEPRSAVARKRRKHGPAVSSAWSASTPTGAKPRGRPPASRSAQDGPYSTFSAHGDHEQSANAASRSIEPPLEIPDSVASDMPPPSTRSTIVGSAGGRPARLSLTVPQHSGGPVRLATPPRVVVHGDDKKSESGSVSQTPEPSMFPSFNRHNAANAPANSFEAGTLSFETLKRTLASDLLRATLVGRPQHLTGDEAKRLADAVLEKLNVSRTENADLRVTIARLTAASWLGLGDQLNIPSGPAAGSTKKIRVTRFRTGDEGYEEVIPAEEDSSPDVRQIFDLRWQAAQGSCQAKFELNGLVLAPHASKGDEDIHDLIINKVLAEAHRVGIAHDLGDFESRATRSFERYGSDLRKGMGAGDGDEGVDWKAKYKMMEFGSSLAHGEFDRFKAMMLQKVIDLFL